MARAHCSFEKECSPKIIIITIIFTHCQYFNILLFPPDLLNSHVNVRTSIFYFGFFICFFLSTCYCHCYHYFERMLFLYKVKIKYSLNYKIT